jgi:tetratricopeptide (TPR) repeat protein
MQSFNSPWLSASLYVNRIWDVFDTRKDMSAASNRSSRKKPKYQELFDESVSILLDEIELAVKWERPSILVAVCGTDFVRANVQADLEHRLVESGQQVHYLLINEEQYNIATIISSIPDRENTIFFVSGLKWGGGENGNNAFRALNLQRETFIENQIRIVLWLTESESNDLPYLAPDFWVFRHRVVEFKQPPMNKRNISFSGGESWGEWIQRLPLDNLNHKITLREKLLASLPDEDESQFSRADLLYTLASLYWARGDFEKAINRLGQGLAIARQLQAKDFEAQIWFGLGVVYHQQGNHQKAVEAYQNGIQQDPNNGDLWRNLSVVFRDLGRARDAIQACKKAIRLDPQDAGSWNNLGNVYRDIGRIEAAISAYQTAVDLNPNDASPWKNLAQVYLTLERIPDAIDAYEQALKRRPEDGTLCIDLATCYRRADQFEKADAYIKMALPLIEDESEYTHARLEAIQGNVEQSLKLLKVALMAEQISIELVKQDHAFDFIRSDARFTAFIQKN